MLIRDLLDTRPVVSNRAQRRVESSAERRAELAARKKRQRKLTNSEQRDKEMVSKYKEMERLKPAATIANIAFTWLGKYLTSGEMSGFSAQITGANINQYSLKQMTAAAMDRLSTPAKFVKLVKPKIDKATKKVIEPGSVLVRITTPEVRLRMRLINSTTYRSNEDDQAKNIAEVVSAFESNSAIIEKHLSTVFPGFKVPRQFMIRQNPLRGREIAPVMAAAATSPMKLAQLDKIIQEGSKVMDIPEDEEVDFRDPSLGKFRDRVEVQFRVINEKSVLLTASGMQSGMIDRIIQEEGDDVMTHPRPITKLVNYARHNPVFMDMEVSADIYLRYPLDYALWATCSKNIDEFDPVLFADLHNRRMAKAVMNKRGMSNPPFKTSHMNRVSKSIRQHEEHYKHKFKPRTNAENFCATKTGLIIWAPPIDMTEEHTKLYKSLYNAETGEVLPTNSLPELRNRLILTDWFMSKVVFTTNEGELHVEDLSGAGKLSNGTIYNYVQKIPLGMNEPLYNFLIQSSNKFENILSFDPFVQRIDEELKKKYPDSYRGLFRPSFTNIVSNIVNLYPKITLAEIANPTLLDLSEENDARFFAQCRAFTEYMTELWKIVSSQYASPPALGSSLSMYDRVRMGMFYIALCGKYASQFEELRTEYFEEVEKNGADLDLDLDDYQFEISNMPGLTHVLPHQFNWIGRMDKREPKNALEQVSVGGGKTPMAISDAVKMIEKKRVKRALIVMPQNLLSQYSSEVQFFSQGRLNVVAITTESVDTMMKNIEDFDDKALIKIIKEAPRNTIFLTSYDFLKKADASNPEKRLVRRPEDDESNVLFRQSEMVYGPFSFGKSGGAGGGARLFPMVELFSRCGFEFIGLDESHRAKETTTSDIAIAAANLMATAKYKRFLSGTVVTDKATDMVGPMSMIAPEVLGTKEAFAERFMKSGQLLPGKSREIEELISPHIKSLIFTQKDWAFIMPNIIQTKVEARMTPMQQAFYDTLMKQAVAKFEKEVELLTGKKPGEKEMELFYDQLEEQEDGSDMPPSKSDSEEETTLQEKIEDIAKRALVRVEVFISAPDEDRERAINEDEGDIDTMAFKNFSIKRPDGSVQKPTKEDLVSPKAKATYGILAAHFFGKTYAGVLQDTSEHNKVVIFSYNKPISRHIMRHMPPELKAQTIRYVASRTPEDKDEDLLPAKKALQKFITDPKIKILIADETSMAEGFNLQMASRLIRIQTVWSPGRQEQVNGRVLRPDPKNKYKRENIYVNLVSAAHIDAHKVTVDDVKIARMLSKIISKARMDFRNTPDWNNQMENHTALKDLPLVSMNLSKIDQMTKDDLNRYNTAASVYYDWLAKQFQKEREKLLEQLRKIHGPQVTMDDVRSLAMKPVVHKPDMEGSALGFNTILFGQKIHDRYELDLIPLADADLLEEEQNGIETSEGQAVWTMFGPGYIKTQYKNRDGTYGNTVTVEVPTPQGIWTVSVPRGSVQVSSSEEGQRRFDNLMRIIGDQGMPTIGPDGTPIKVRELKNIDLDKKRPKVETKPKFLPVVDEDEEDERPRSRRAPLTPDGLDDDDEADNEILIRPASISGLPALVLMNNHEPTKRRFLEEFPNWQLARRYYATQIKSFNSFKNALEILQQNFTISPKRMRYLNETRETLYTMAKRDGQRGVFFDSQTMSDLEVKNFFMQSHKLIKQPKGTKPIIEPWLMMWGNSVFLCFDSIAHGAKVMSKIRIKLSRVTPKLGAMIEYPQEENDERVFFFFRSRMQAKQMMRRVAEIFEVDEFDETMEYIDSIKAVKQKTERPTKRRREEETKTKIITMRKNKKPASKTAKSKTSTTKKKRTA